MPAPARAARVGWQRLYMPRKPLARHVAPLPQQTGYGRELREKGFTKDGVGCAEAPAATVRFEGFSGRRDATGMAPTTAVAAGTAERSRRRRRGRSGKKRLGRDAPAAYGTKRQSVPENASPANCGHLSRRQRRRLCHLPIFPWSACASLKSRHKTRGIGQEHGRQ